LFKIVHSLVKINITVLNVTEVNNVLFDCEIQPNLELEEILGNMKPLINILQDEINTVPNIGTINIYILL